jgi:hypothetical protein
MDYEQKYRKYKAKYLMACQALETNDAQFGGNVFTDLFGKWKKPSEQQESEEKDTSRTGFRTDELEQGLEQMKKGH